jgi:magnesium chelatase subunit D
MDGPQWDDVELAAAAFAVAPAWLGGVALQGLPGPVRDSWLQRVRELLPPDQTVRRIPLHVSESQLLGGLDLTATLSAGKPIAATGLLADCNGGVVVLAMAERAARVTLSHLAGVLDFREVLLERDGFSARIPSELGVIALDESVGDDEALSEVLRDRLALAVDLRPFGIHDLDDCGYDAEAVVAARAVVDKVELNESQLAAICSLAQVLGVPSIRACQFAARTARVIAALNGRLAVDDSDIAAAARLVIAPRATRLPMMDTPEEDNAADHNEGPADGSPSSGQPDDAAAEPEAKKSAVDNDQPLEDRVLEAAVAAIPQHLLAQLKDGRATRQPNVAGGKSGAVQRSHLRGRPKGVIRGHLRSGARLSLMDTLRAAAPWQKLRRQQQAAASAPGRAGEARVLVRPDDFHVRRFKQRAETTTIFVVDASGSAALHRLAEAKGAVELLLADCYVRRDQVALIAFRGQSADVLLPPTRSLVRAKRSIAALPGGGGTPLAAAVDAAALLAEQILRRGGTPGLIFLTDGRANISREGSSGREQALNEALESAAVLRLAGVRSMVIDTSPRPHTNAAKLADALAGVYLPLPHADAAALSRAAQAAANPGDRR